MHISLILLLSSSQVPKITVGPEAKNLAPQVKAPIEHVTVYSDRALVKRQASVLLTTGINTLRLPDLAGAAQLDSIRVSASKGRVLRVEAYAVKRERFAIEQIEAEVTELEKLADEAIKLNAQITAERSELDLLNQLSPAPALSEAEREGRPSLKLAPSAWFSAIDFLETRAEAQRSRIRKLEKARDKLAERRTLLKEKINQVNLGGFTDRRLEVFVALASKSPGKSRIELTYFIPGASWKPVYDLEYLPAVNRMTVRTAAMVQQATGEDWRGVKLSLSTSIPGQGIEVPKMLTWTLGEKRQFMPKPRAARRPPIAPRYPIPEARPTASELERSLKLEDLKERLALLNVSPRSARARVAKEAQSYKRQRAEESRRRQALKLREKDYYGRKKSAKRRARPKPPAPPPRPAPAPSREMAADAPMRATSTQSVVVSESAGSSIQLGGLASGPGRASGAKSVLRTSLNLFQRSADRRGPRFGDPFLPAVSAGGLDYVYRAPTSSDIPSDGQSVRVPLRAERFPVEAIYEATPSLKTTAYLKARVVNKGERPFLRGPTNNFVGGEFIGQGELATTGPGGVLQFPLGADENIRLVRKVLPRTETEGFISKDDVTTYETVIEIGNYKKRAVTIEIVDQIPKTSNEDIEIKLLSATPRPEEKPDASGIMRWRLNLGPGDKKEIKLRYSITRPTDWQLYQQ